MRIFFKIGTHQQSVPDHHQSYWSTLLVRWLDQNSNQWMKLIPSLLKAAARQTHNKAYTQRKTLLVEKFVCLRQRRSRILRGRSRAERTQDSAGMKRAHRTEEGWIEIGNRTNEEWMDRAEMGDEKVIHSTATVWLRLVKRNMRKKERRIKRIKCIG